MQRNNGHHSKGKGRDLADRLGELNLDGTKDSSIPRSGQLSYHQYDQLDYSPSEYTNTVAYTHQSQGSHNTAPALAYGGGYEDYGIASPTIPRDSTMTGAASSYAPSSSHTSSSYESSYAPSSYAASSYAPSHASTVQSSAPSRYETGTVNHQIAQQQPPLNRYELPCEFRILTGCTARYQGGEEREWKEHHEEHLKHNFPTRLACWFCDTFTFDANRLYGGDKSFNFQMRMDHIRDHIMDDGYSASSMRPDGCLINHLKHEKVINSQTYDEILNRLNPTTAPPIPGGRSARTLGQVKEEPASSSWDRRQERKDKHESSKKKHRR